MIEDFLISLLYTLSRYQRLPIPIFLGLLLLKAGLSLAKTCSCQIYPKKLLSISVYIKNSQGLNQKNETDAILGPQLIVSCDYTKEVCLDQGCIAANA